MSETQKPAAFRLDSDEAIVAPPEATPVPAYATDPMDNPLPPARGRSRWANLFWLALGSLVSLGFGLAATRLIEDLFARAPWLGYVALALTLAAVLAALVLGAREWIVLRRLERVDALRQQALEAVATKNDAMAANLATDVVRFCSRNSRTAEGRTAYARITSDHIIDGLDRLRLVERDILEPLDRQAMKLITDSARRVSIVTALSPRAAVDIAMVFATTTVLVRRIAEIYGGHPGSIGMMKLMRRILTHLALTGGMAAADSVVDQFVGAGLASKLSAKLGEGVLNGLLTARLGVAAIDLCRPLPFIGTERPNVRDVLAHLKGG